MRLLLILAISVEVWLLLRTNALLEQIQEDSMGCISPATDLPHQWALHNLRHPRLQ